MKVCDFQLFTDRNLPRDFLQNYQSAWVTPNSHQWSDPVRRHREYEDTLEELTLASELGFDGVCVNEHHNSLFSTNPAPNIFATAPRAPVHSELFACNGGSGANIGVIGTRGEAFYYTPYIDTPAGALLRYPAEAACLSSGFGWRGGDGVG